MTEGQQLLPFLEAKPSLAPQLVTSCCSHARQLTIKTCLLASRMHTMFDAVSALVSLGASTPSHQCHAPASSKPTPQKKIPASRKAIHVLSKKRHDILVREAAKMAARKQRQANELKKRKREQRNKDSVEIKTADTCNKKTEISVINTTVAPTRPKDNTTNGKDSCFPQGQQEMNISIKE